MSIPWERGRPVPTGSRDLARPGLDHVTLTKRSRG